MIAAGEAVDFIFMLTRSDETVVDCLETWDSIRDVGLRHAGFKDVGVDVSTLIELNRRMRDRGVTTYLEVVSTSPEACLQSARAAVEIGVDRLMGGQQITETLQLIRGTSIEYLPFPGVPVGHPTRLAAIPRSSSSSPASSRRWAAAEWTCSHFERPRPTRSIS
jgi:hypothetical protein